MTLHLANRPTLLIHQTDRLLQFSSWKPILPDLLMADVVQIEEQYKTFVLGGCIKPDFIYVNQRIDLPNQRFKEGKRLISLETMAGAFKEIEKIGNTPVGYMMMPFIELPTLSIHIHTDFSSNFLKYIPIYRKDTFKHPSI